MASEGYATEPLYFQALDDNREVVGIPERIQVLALQRESADAGVSDPIRVVDLLDTYMKSLRSGRYSLDLILEQVRDQMPDPDPELKSKVLEKCSNLVDEEGFAVDPNAVVAILKEIFSESYGVELEYRPRELPEYREGIDRICVVIDRDRENRDATKMDEFLHRCSQSGYEPYISNPCFELWLLMHFDEYDMIDRNILLKNPMKGSKRFTESELDKILRNKFNRGYKKSEFDTMTFVQRTDEAIKRSLTSCVDPHRLKSELGTNLGLLLKEMKQEDAERR